MNENLNLVEILKDCPKGTKLYSTIFGEIKFGFIEDNSIYPIVLILLNGGHEYLTSDGKLYETFGGECILFPSKDQRDWSNFKPKQPKFDPKTLNPFDKVFTNENKKNMKAIEVHQEVIALLEAFGYKPEVKVNKPTVGYIDICFPVKYGSETMPTRHKDAISMLAKGYLSEFYYASGNQHVYLRNECNGLKPNDDRYSCLIHEMRLVSSNEPCFGNGQEVFVNMGDHFKRFVNWKEVSSEE